MFLHSFSSKTENRDALDGTTKFTSNYSWNKYQGYKNRILIDFLILIIKPGKS